MEQILFSITRIALYLFPYLHILAIIVGVIFVISGVLDSGLDLFFIGRAIRRFFISRKWPKLTLERLQAREQQKIAIFIACWHEEDVIAHTLTNAVKTIEYRNYDIFVGTYPNDPKTQTEVDRVARKYPHVHKVITPEPGPTNKPSNLNYIFAALKDYEIRTRQHYEIIMTHDSEDVIHPYSLLVINYLIPRKDMVQLPVFPLALPLREFTHWTYADEFAEYHTKLLLVRELSGGFVPAAGVGVAFTRRVFEFLSFEHLNQVFSTNTLTEDYELGLRLNLEGFRAAFVLVKLPLKGSKKKRNKDNFDWVATRAYFPRKFWQAVRQKTRWNIGIVLQAWQNIGWKGGFSVRWNLFQDRKALITTPTNFLAYFVFLYFIVYQLLQTFYTQFLPPLIIKGTLLWYLVLASTFFMIWRLINRAWSVGRIYGFWPAVVSIPRAIWGNIINFFAIVRAIYQFTMSRIRGQKIAWDKTAHEFPMVEIQEALQPEASMAEGFTPKISARELEEKVKTQVAEFNENIKSADIEDRVDAIHAINRDCGPFLLSKLVELIEDPAWQIRAEVCRTLSFLRYSQALPLLENAATDSDWTVRSNAVRAIGKLGELGELYLLRIIQGDDPYARDAALAVLEHQGFFEQNLQKINSRNREEIKSGLIFFDVLDRFGASKLAHEVLQRYMNSKPASTKTTKATAVKVK